MAAGLSGGPACTGAWLRGWSCGRCVRCCSTPVWRSAEPESDAKLLQIPRSPVSSWRRGPGPKRLGGCSPRSQAGVCSSRTSVVPGAARPDITLTRGSWVLAGGYLAEMPVGTSCEWGAGPERIRIRQGRRAGIGWRGHILRWSGSARAAGTASQSCRCCRTYMVHTERSLSVAGTCAPCAASWVTPSRPRSSPVARPSRSAPQSHTTLRTFMKDEPIPFGCHRKGHRCCCPRFDPSSS